MLASIQESNINTATTMKPLPWLLFICVATFFFFEAIQMSYFDIIAPYFIKHHWYNSHEIGALSAAYYYGNVVGVIPAGHGLDKKNIRNVMLFAISLSVFAAFILAFTNHFFISWLARFICGFFGGAYCFLGGTKVLSKAFPRQFTFAMGLFITAGMLAGMVAQLPILWVITREGISCAMLVVSIFGACVLIINWFWLYPEQTESANIFPKNNSGWMNVILQWRNIICGIIISAINTPVSILGNLWGIVVLTHLYHFSEAASGSIIMLLFFGLIIGSPLIGVIADRYKASNILVYLGCIGSTFTIGSLILFGNKLNMFDVGICFLVLGIFSSCQTLVYTWIKQNNTPQTTGRSMALNSIIIMGIGGLVKQIPVETIQFPAYFGFIGSASNLLVMIGVAMLLAALFALLVNRYNQDS